MQPQDLQPQQLLLQQALGQHFFLHLGGHGLGGHLRSTGRGAQALLHPHPQHPAKREGENPRLNAAAARPSAIGLNSSFDIIKTPNLRIPHSFNLNKTG